VGGDKEEVSVVLVKDNNEYVSMCLPIPKFRPLSNHIVPTFKSLVVTQTHL